MKFEHARAQMVEQQVRSFEVLDARVLDVMRDMPRELFVPEIWQSAAYADGGVPIGHGQRLLSPQVTGRILQALTLQRGDSVLEVGAGSGYVTACLAQLGAKVTSIESNAALVEQANLNLERAGIDDVRVSEGSAPEALGKERYDAIAVGAAVARNVTAFEERLELGGRLFVVYGEGPVMTARLTHRVAESRWYSEALFETHLPYLDGFAPEETFEF